MSATQLPPVQAGEQIPSPRRRTPVMDYVRPAIVMTLLLTVITGLLYPGIITALAQVIFPYQANGSLHTVNGKIIGSDLIGQQWTSPKYFHGRPSATLNASGTPAPYSADNSSASNIGPTNKQLINGNGGTYKGVKNYADQFRKENGLAPNTPLPSDIVTASGSGLDPDISPEAAFLQVTRVAQARGLSQDTIHKLVEDHIQGRFLWIFGEPYVNVLEINLALDGTK